MDDSIRRALAGGLTCDITTTGRASGKPRRIATGYFVVGGRVYSTGTPGPRDWYANLLAQPRFIFHVKQGAHADLPARPPDRRPGRAPPRHRRGDAWEQLVPLPELR